MKKTLLPAIITAVLLLVPGVYAYAEECKKDAHQHCALEAKNDQAPPTSFSTPQKEGVKATCPVLGTVFTISKDTLHSEYKGRYVYFCCAGCKPDFDRNPGKYLKNVQSH